MRKLFLFASVIFCQLSYAAENDLPVQDADQQGSNNSVEQESAPISPDSNQEPLNGGDDLIAATVDEINEVEEESSVRFIPTEEISQDLGVSFPIDI